MNHTKNTAKRPGLFINNLRFYILVMTLMVSIFIACFMRTNIVSEVLFLIRLQQVYGFMALGFWYCALLATPVGVVLGKKGFMAHYLFARRALGVSGAYFASLHMLLGVFGQLGGPGSLLNLPLRFQQALLLGFTSLVVLIIMAATSFDTVIKRLTFARWKWIHRLSYPAIALVLLHMWLIGTHLQYAPARILILVSIGLLAILESWRVSINIEKLSGNNDTKLRLIIFFSLTVIVIGLLIYVPYSTSRYHASSHTESGVHR